MVNIDILKKIALEAVANSKPTAFIIGNVVKADPLEIQIEQKLNLTSQFLILTNEVKDHFVDITVQCKSEEKSGGSGDSAFSSHSHDIKGKKKVKVHNALKTGEKVLLARIQGGQKFIVLSRVSEYESEGEWL